MNAEDTALCQRAIDLANSGQKQMAYQQFCALHQRGNTEDVTLLYWIAYTTPAPEEALRAIVSIARLEPGHPKLPELQQYIGRMQQSVVPAPPPGWFGPVLQCPYCHSVRPARIAQKISTGGWVSFGVLLLVFFPLCWIGLLIKKDYYVCASCGIALGDIT